MVGFPVLTTLQPIIGVDFHKATPPPPPAGPVFAPHIVVWMSGLSQMTGFLWAVASTSKASSPQSAVSKPVRVGPAYACGRGHDAGPHPSHIWPNIFYPLILLGSASRCEFGSSTVKISVSARLGGSADMGVNVAYIMNLNLDCHDFPFPPMPTGLCLTTNYTVYAGFSLKDFFHGLVQMLVDSFLSWAVAGFCAALGNVIKGLISSLGKGAVLATIGKQFQGFFSFGPWAPSLMRDGAGFFVSNGRLFVNAWKFIPGAAANWWKAAPAANAVDLAMTGLGTFGIGGPIGYAPENAPVGGSAPWTVGSRAAALVDKLFE